MRQADDPGQQPGRAHVGAGQADPRKEKGDLGALRRDPDVARRRDHGARAGHRPVERRHDRAAAMADGQDEIAGEAGELEQPAASRENSAPMMSSTSPPVQKARPVPVMMTARTPGSLSRARKVSLSSV